MMGGSESRVCIKWPHSKRKKYIKDFPREVRLHHPTRSWPFGSFLKRNAMVARSPIPEYRLNWSLLLLLFS